MIHPGWGQIALVAWGVRQLRRVLARRQHEEKKSEGPKQSSLPVKSMELPLFAHLSPLAVQKLIELDPTPYILIDVRFPDASQLDLIPFDNVIHIPGTLESTICICQCCSSFLSLSLDLIDQCRITIHPFVIELCFAHQLHQIAYLSFDWMHHTCVVSSSCSWFSHAQY
jgi:hypothetical protein